MPRDRVRGPVVDRPEARGDDLLEMLDLDAEVLHDYWDTALSWVQQAVVGCSPTRILDLGAGVGAGAIGLSERFPEAEVLAVDIDAASLKRLRDKAFTAGRENHVRTLEADLDAVWPHTGQFDLTWASMSLHQLADPDRVLRDVVGSTRPGGMIAVAEFAESLRFLPTHLDLGRPGLEDRIAGALRDENANTAPGLGAVWAKRLSAAGWRVAAERDVAIDLDPPTHPRAGVFAQGWFERLVKRAGHRLEPDDRVAIAALLDQDAHHALIRRPDLHIRGARTLTLGVRVREI